MNQLQFKPAFTPGAAVTDNTAQVSTILNVYGFGSAVLAFVTGTLTDADAAFALTFMESNDSGMAGANTVATTDMTGTTALASFGFADDSECRKIGYIGSKSYIQATITPSANTGNLFVAGMWIQGHPTSAPTANPPQ
jgi:hypothetical protein